MGNKKKKKSAKCKNAYWTNIKNAFNTQRMHAHTQQKNTHVNANFKCSIAKAYQASHQQIESVQELTDDTSPDNPMLPSTSGVVAGETNESVKQKHKDMKEFLAAGSSNQKKPEAKQKMQDIECSSPPQMSFCTDIKFHVQNKASTSQACATQVVLNPIQVGKQIQSRVTRVNTDPLPQKYKPSETLSGPGFCYPKGIPKSFLLRPPKDLSEPYSQYKIALQKFNLPQQQMKNQRFSTPEQHAGSRWVANVWDTHSPNPVMPPVATTEDIFPLHVQTDGFVEHSQIYSPSDVYAETSSQDPRDDSKSPPDLGQKRPSAFDRLGPISEPKKPKLTINLLFDKEGAVREVVDETEDKSEHKEKHIPVHQRRDIMTSTDETVMKYLVFWPWQRDVAVKRSVTARNSKTVMLLELEQMEEVYDRDQSFVQISVRGYPRTWNKENVLDALLEAVKGKSFIPCFTEFSPQECKFLVIKCKQALVCLHKTGFFIRKNEVELLVTISQVDLGLHQLDFIPRLILRKRLSMGFDGEGALNLSEFTTKDDISHFIYFPLHRTVNQMDLINMQSNVPWEYLTSLNLSRNRITSFEGFNISSVMPKLKHLDLSFNYLEKATLLRQHRTIVLTSIKLEGNPLCHDYIDSGHYVKVLKIMFPALKEIDGIPVHLKGEMPAFKRNYCPYDAKALIERFLEVYFPLLDSNDHNREQIANMYHEKASLTITYRFKLRYGPVYRTCHALFNRSRVLEEGDTDSTDGAAEIAKLIHKWPPLKHDPFTFTVDVLSHDDHLTIFKVAGIFKLTAETLAEDEHILAFSRTFVVHSYFGDEYKIVNDLLQFDIPTRECANIAFRMTAVKLRRISLKLESEPDDDLKEKLIQIFMQVTEMNRQISESTLQYKNWNLRSALDYFMKVLKLDNLENLTRGIKI